MSALLFLSNLGGGGSAGGGDSGGTIWRAPQTGDDIQLYPWHVRFLKGVKERAWAAGAFWWPAPNYALWDTGVITAVAANGDGSYAVNVASTNVSSALVANRFFNWSNPSALWQPANYDLLVDSPFDETWPLHLKIYANTAKPAGLASFSFTVESNAAHIADHVIADALTSNFLASPGDLVGKTYWVLKRGGIFWHERWLAWPNVREKYTGTSISTNGTGATDSTATYPLNADGTGKFSAGCELMLRGSDTLLHRIPLTGNDKTDLFFAALPGGVTVSGNYAVIPAGGKWRMYSDIAQLATDANLGTEWAPRSGMPFLWSNSTPATWWTRSAHTGALASTKLPAQTITLAGGNFCEQFYQQAIFDVDFFTPIDDACNPTDHSYNPNEYRTFHGAQAALEALCGFFVKNQSYEGAASIPAFSIARFFEAAGINATRVTLGALTGGVTIAGTSYSPTINFSPAWSLYPGTPIVVWFDVLLASGDTQEAGLCTLASSSSLTLPAGAIASLTWIPSIASAFMPGHGFVFGQVIKVSGAANSFLNGTFQIYAVDPNNFSYSIVSGTAGSDSGKPVAQATFNSTQTGSTCVLSAGWTRHYDNEFLYLYPKTCWLPTYDPVHGFITTPTSSQPGTWITRPASTKYKESDPYGFVRDGNGYRSFISGASGIARYSGDDNNDPSCHILDVNGASGAASPLDAAGLGQWEVPTSDTTGQQTYWNNFYEGTPIKSARAAYEASKQGNATGGDRFYLQDTSKNWYPSGTFFTLSGTATSGSTTSLSDTTIAAGFFTGNWLNNFTIEIDLNGDGSYAYRRFITSVTSGTSSVGWNDALPSSCNGKAWRIRAPQYEPNRWQGRTLQVTLADGTVHTVVISGSDDKNIYFPTQTWTVTANAIYQIVEQLPGPVMQWNGSAWSIVTGTDSRNGRSFRSNPNNNQPTWNKAYGKIRKGDIFDYSGSDGIFAELYGALRALVWVKWPFTWTARGEINMSRNDEITADPSWSDIVSQVTSYWPGDIAHPGSAVSQDGVPYAFSYTETASFVDGYGVCQPACYTLSIERRYAYGEVQGIRSYEYSAVDFYVYSLISSGPGGETTGIKHENFPGPPQEADFDAEGDGTVYEGYHLFSSLAASQDPIRYSAKLGSLTQPTIVGPAPPYCPGGVGSTGTLVHGYVPTQWTAVVRWNIPNGFLFQ